MTFLTNPKPQAIRISSRAVTDFFPSSPGGPLRPISQGGLSFLFPTKLVRRWLANLTKSSEQVQHWCLTYGGTASETPHGPGNRRCQVQWAWHVESECWVAFFLFSKTQEVQKIVEPPGYQLIHWYQCTFVLRMCSLFFPKWDMRSKLVHSERQQIIHGFPKCCPLCSMRFLFGRPERPAVFFKKFNGAIFCQLVVRIPLHGSS